MGGMDQSEKDKSETIDHLRREQSSSQHPRMDHGDRAQREAEQQE